MDYTSVENSKKNKAISLSISLGFHVALLLTFYFFFSYSPPDPPLGTLGYGVELNFGTSDLGSGDLQPEAEKSPDTPPKEVSEPENSTPISKESQTSLITEEQGEEIALNEPIDKKVEKKITEPDFKEKKEVKIIEKPKTVNEDAIFKPEGNANKSKGDGNDANSVGDKGKKEGATNNSGIFEGNLGQGGNGSGGSGGSTLDLAGWEWERKPNPKDKSNEGGKIVFQIKIDEYGEIIEIRVLEKTVSAEVVSIYRSEIEKLSFVRSGGSSDLPPQISTGKITFIIKSR